jgi:hypothetical protein
MDPADYLSGLESALVRAGCEHVRTDSDALEIEFVRAFSGRRYRCRSNMVASDFERETSRKRRKQTSEFAEDVVGILTEFEDMIERGRHERNGWTVVAI